MTRIPKSIDLIVATTMHKYAEKIAMVRAVMSSMSGKALKTLPVNVNEEAARTLLCDIAHDADVTQVMKALQAVGAPATLDLIGEGLRHIEERAKVS